MYYVKVEGKSLADLKHGLEKHLEELSCYGESTVSVKTNVTVVEEEMEEVESPYKDFASPEYGVGPVPSVSEVKPALTTVVDNEVDAEGIPWDDRIHASSKAKVGNGTWRTKRGCDENVLYQVKNELRARVQTAVVQATAPVYVAPAPVVAAPVSHPIAESLKPVEVPVAQAPVAAAPLPLMQSSGHSLDTFKSNFPLIVSTLITEKKINQDYVNQLKTYFNIAEIWMANDEQKAQVFEQFVQYGFVQKVG